MDISVRRQCREKSLSFVDRRHSMWWSGVKYISTNRSKKTRPRKLCRVSKRTPHSHFGPKSVSHRGSAAYSKCRRETLQAASLRTTDAHVLEDERTINGRLGVI